MQFLGSDIGTLEDLKCNHLKKIFVNNKELTEPIAENLSLYILKFLEGENFTHIFSPSTTFGKISPKISAELDVQQISDIINIIDKTFEDQFMQEMQLQQFVLMILQSFNSSCYLFEQANLESNVEMEGSLSLTCLVI